MTERFDYIVIGAGVGGYPAAIQLAQMGYKVSIIEKDKVGGECTNYGCIPTKVMVHEAYILTELNKRGIFPDLRNYFTNAVNKRNSTVNRVREGIEYVLEKNDVKVINGVGKLYSSDPKVEVSLPSGEKKSLEARKVLIATGSYPVFPWNLGDITHRIHDSRTILEIEEVPRSLAIIGGGAVGVEYAFVFSSMGSEVYIIEKSDNVLSGMDEDVRNALKRALVRAGVNLSLNDTLYKIEQKDGLFQVFTTKMTFISDTVLIAIGRRPNTTGLGVENAGIKTDEKGFIVVDEYLQTSNPNFFAVGDVVGHPMLAHKAIHQSLVAAKNMAGERIPFRKTIPIVIYGIPYCGGVGKVPIKEEIAEGKYKAVRFNYTSLSMANVMGETEGFLKLVLDKCNKIVGAHACGPESDMIISSLTMAIEHGLTLEELSDIVYPHPSISEAIRESALIGLERPIHTVLFRK